MRLRFAAILSLLGACAPQDVAESSGRARYDAYPDRLIQAFESSCAGPGQTFTRPAPDLVECRQVLPPDPTAAIILTYGGTIRDLPQLVVRFRTRPEGAGYIVENTVFLDVPQESGPPRLIQRADPGLSRTLDKLYRASGGVPEIAPE